MDVVEEKLQKIDTIMPVIELSFKRVKCLASLYCQQRYTHPNL